VDGRGKPGRCQNAASVQGAQRPTSVTMTSTQPGSAAMNARQPAVSPRILEVDTRRARRSARGVV
jgi:hypothetical protein